MHARVGDLLLVVDQEEGPILRRQAEAAIQPTFSFRPLSGVNHFQRATTFSVQPLAGFGHFQRVACRPQRETPPSRFTKLVNPPPPLPLRPASVLVTHLGVATIVL